MVNFGQEAPFGFQDYSVWEGCILWMCDVIQNLKDAEERWKRSRIETRNKGGSKMSVPIPQCLEQPQTCA